jgi:hypothetical protein
MAEMTADQELSALRRLLFKRPSIGLKTAFRLVREQEAARVMTDRLRAEIRQRRDIAQMQAADGATEGLV